MSQPCCCGVSDGLSSPTLVLSAFTTDDQAARPIRQLADNACELFFLVAMCILLCLCILVRRQTADIFASCRQSAPAYVLSCCHAVLQGARVINTANSGISVTKPFVTIAV